MDETLGSRKSPVLAWLKVALRLLIFTLVVWGIARTVDEARGKFAAAAFSPSQLHAGWLVLAGISYLLGMLPCCIFWQRTLCAMGQKPYFLSTLRAFYLSQLGKYVPGKALVVIIRAGLIRGRQVDTAVAATSVFVETLTMMAVGAMLAAVILALKFRQHQTLLLAALAMAVGAGVPTLPPVFRRLVRVLQVHRTSSAMHAALSGLNVRLMLFGWLIISGGWLLMGGSLWATLHAMPGVQLSVQDLPLLTVCVCLAVVAGFVSMLPGGIGVRELVVMKLLSPPFGEVAAIVSAVLLRLVWLAAEVVLAGILYFAVHPER